MTFKVADSSINFVLNSEQLMKNYCKLIRLSLLNFTIARVITAYRVRNNTWKLLGKGDPHAAQVFIQSLLKHNTIIKLDRNK